jgi:hypothetical protein
MKATKIKVSVSQDGLLPQETAEIATVDFPVFQKKLLKALGFERVDSETFVGVLPVFIHLLDKQQEIEVELGVGLPEMRKKVLEILLTPSTAKQIIIEKPKKKPRASKTAAPKAPPKAPQKAPRPKKTVTKKVTAKKTKGTK